MYEERTPFGGMKRQLADGLLESGWAYKVETQVRWETEGFVEWVDGTHTFELQSVAVLCPSIGVDADYQSNFGMKKVTQK